jgi:exonuclease III
MGSENILIWNVRGLNARSHCDDVWDLIGAERSSIVCLQETKLNVITDFDLIQIVETGFDYCYLPTEGTRGGILVAWRTTCWSASWSSLHLFSVSIRLKHISQDHEWWLTSVYGPSVVGQKAAFLNELNELRLIRIRP